MKSFFLFGPRSTGKSTLIANQLPDAVVYDLLDQDTFAKLARRPALIIEENPDPSVLVAIDEIQRLPSLLNEIHRLISKRGMTFLLTGSSARKLRHGGANLLAGRAWEAHLFPLVSAEIPTFNLVQYLNQGGLPHIYGSPHAAKELHHYINLYLREEVQAEALVRNISGFAAFLDVMALANGEELNYTGLASDCGLPPRTLQNYVDILEDTLIGFRLKPFLSTKKRKAITRAKHYLFDVGVAASMAKRGPVEPGSEAFGRSFEHFIVQELRAYLSYRQLPHEFCYWRSTTGFEVDVVIGRRLALEIKSSTLVSDRQLKGLRALREEGLVESYAVVSLDTTKRQTEDGISIYPCHEFLRDLWSDTLLSGRAH